MNILDAFKSLEDIDDIEVKPVAKKKVISKTLKESVNEEKKVIKLNISGDDMYEKGQAYYYAHTGDKVDYKGKTYEIIEDKEGGHRIGYTDVLLLKDVETGEEIEVAKKDFIKEATLLKEGCKECKIEEAFNDYWVLSDGKNPKNSSVYPEIKDLDAFIADLEKAVAENSRHGYWELLHFVDGKDTKVWDTEHGRVTECKEACELKEEPYLEPEYDSRQSFYKKAYVDEKADGSKVLYSYGTPVCRIKDGKATLLRKGYLGWASSQTTLRHVKEFLKQNGFKADSMKQMAKDYPVEQAGINESIDKKKLLEAETIDINDEEEVKKGKEILNKDADDSVEQIVDVDADTVDKLKDSYIGNTILQCPVCRTLIYKKPDAIIKDEETEYYNVGESCPHCASEDGFELVGQVAPVSVPVEEPEQTTGKEEPEVPEQETKVEVETDVKDVEEGPADEEEKKLDGPAIPTRKLNVMQAESLESSKDSLIEDFDEVKFDKLVNRYLNTVYDNVDKFETTSGKIVEDVNTIIVEGNITFKSGKVTPVTFKFKDTDVTKGGKYKLSGLCEKLSDNEKAFVVVGSVKNKNFIPESLAYNYTSGALEESKTIRGRVSLKKIK